jgi:DMSO/TMAO reductase YedYZ molybdopterin-dependent catalytic subunit
LHSTGIATQIGPFSAMWYHVAAAIAAVPFAIWHVVARRIRVRRTDFSRRAVLRGAAVGAMAAAGYAGSELIVRATGLPGAARRFTGSYESSDLPVSNWLFDPVPVIDATEWTLTTPKRTWTVADLARFDDEITATLDCTGGFYSTHRWAGARLDRLLEDTPGQSIRVVSHTGYDRRFPIDEASRLLLATSLGGLPLDPGHGHPARLVSADRRGFWWVKWVVAIEVDDLPHWWQPPFPLQ